MARGNTGNGILINPKIHRLDLASDLPTIDLHPISTIAFADKDSEYGVSNAMRIVSNL
jgi:hypothetical protein